MSQPASGSEKCNNNLEGSQSVLHGNPVFPFPDFINNKNDFEDHTPINKIPCGSILDRANSAKSNEESLSTCTKKTPPVEPSVSPEIQSNLCRSVLVSGAAPSTCYGAGHVISGVIDRRKCKARGILSVGRKNSLEHDIPEDKSCVSYSKRGQDVFTKSRPSLVPFPPVEASISWHLSPSNVNEDDGVVAKGDHPKQLHESWKLLESVTVPLSSFSPCGSPFMVSNRELQGLLESSSGKVIKKASSTSRDTPHHEPVKSLEERISTSPFSADSLGSGNVMQTPNSDLSLERHASLSWLKESIEMKHQLFEYELDHVTDVLRCLSSSPEENSSPWDPPRLSFELADLDSPSHLKNPNHHRENSDTHASWISNSTSVNMSVSEVQVSWRDGLISSTFDKEDFDCCRLFSDEEVDADDLLKSPGFPEQEVKDDGNGKETSFPIRPNLCAESICTDDGGLIASADSDWTIYYKNQSFET